MKITDILNSQTINEGHSHHGFDFSGENTEMPQHTEDHMADTIVFRDPGGYDRVYHLNRVMMAAALASGVDRNPVDMEPASWIEKYNVGFGYTEVEMNMLISALKTIGADLKHFNSDKKRHEPPSVNRLSPGLQNLGPVRSKRVEEKNKK